MSRTRVSMSAAALRWQALGISIKHMRTKHAYIEPNKLLTDAASARAQARAKAVRGAVNLEPDLELRFSTTTFLREFMYNISWPVSLTHQLLKYCVSRNSRRYRTRV